MVWRIRSGDASSRRELLALSLERRDPAVHAGVRLAARKAGNLEQIVDLLIGELRQQPDEEAPAGLTDSGIVERAGHRLRHVGDAARLVFPDRHARPGSIMLTALVVLLRSMRANRLHSAHDARTF